MSEKVLEFIGSEGLPDKMKVNIQMDMPYDLAVKILDMIQILRQRQLCPGGVHRKTRTRYGDSRGVVDPAGEIFARLLRV